MIERDEEWRRERGVRADEVLVQLVPASSDAGWGRPSIGVKIGVGPGMEGVVAMHADELRWWCCLSYSSGERCARHNRVIDRAVEEAHLFRTLGASFCAAALASRVSLGARLVSSCWCVCVMCRSFARLFLFLIIWRLIAVSFVIPIPLE